MKLTAKIVAAVVIAISKEKDGTWLKVTAEEFQKRLLKKGKITLEEMTELERLSKKAGFGGHFKPLTGKFEYTEYVGGSYRNYQYNHYRIEIIDGSVLSYPYWANEVTKELVLASDSKIEKIDYAVALSAFSTVEEAIDEYPHLQLVFSSIFGKPVYGSFVV